MDPGGQDDGAAEPGEGEPVGVVVEAGDLRPRDRHEQDQARDVEAVGPRRRDEVDGREDDVRPEAEGTGPAHLRRTAEAGRAQEVHGRPSRDRLLQMQVRLTGWVA